MKKFLSVITGAIMAISAFSTVNISAEDTSEKLEEKYYTLEQLIEMPDEEFLALGGSVYSYYHLDAEFMYQYVDNFKAGYFFMPLNGLQFFGYQANITEDKIAELLGDSVKYEVESPIFPSINGSEEGSYLDLTNYLKYTFPDYTGNTDEDIMMRAKIAYCITQVMHFYTEHYGTGGTDEKTTTVQGDVNVDMTLDVFDAIYIAKDSVGQIRFTDLQKKIGDMNNDGNTDVFDAIAIAKDTVK
ncbi:MAG: dockerin type I repeat-containing protein [Porcipelethomonas sp.]